MYTVQQASDDEAVSKDSLMHSGLKSVTNIFRSDKKKDNAKNPDTDEEKENDVIDKDIRGIVRDVVLLGAPVSTNVCIRFCCVCYPLQLEEWKSIRYMVNGRLINGYSSKDAVLGLIYRYERLAVKVAGVQPGIIKSFCCFWTFLNAFSIVPLSHIENIDLSAIVTKVFYKPTVVCNIFSTPIIA